MKEIISNCYNFFLYDVCLTFMKEVSKSQMFHYIKCMQTVKIQYVGNS